MKKLFLFLMLCQLCAQLKGQSENLQDFIVQGDDTTFCFITQVSRAAGQVVKLEYIDADDEKHVIDKKEVANVKTFRIGGYTLDYIPMKPSKPDAYQRHTVRKVDGKIIVHDFINLVATTDKKGNRELYSLSVPVHNHTILIEGKHYDLDKKNIESIVVPYLMKSEAFRTGYTEKITEDTIDAAVTYYNQVNK